MAYVEYVAAITFLGKPEPDDPRPLRDQADEQIEALGYFLADLGAHLEVLSTHASGEEEEGELARAPPPQTGHDNEH